MTHAKALVTAYTLNDPLEAALIRNALHAEGIACELGGLHQAGLPGLMTIEVLTHCNDADRARRLIDSHEYRLHTRRAEGRDV